MGDLVFSNKALRKKLNGITHFAIFYEIVMQLLRYRLVHKARIVILDAPLLYETYWLTLLCYPIIVVSCSERVQKERVIRRDLLSEEQAQGRIDAQMSLMEKVAKCDLVIDNSGTLEELQSRGMSALTTATSMLTRGFKQTTTQRTTL